MKGFPYFWQDFILDKVRFIESFDRKALLVILTSILLLTAVPSGAAWFQADKTDKQEVIQRVAQDWILVGIEQSRRGFYEHAEKSFLQAYEYREYLTGAEREKLNELLQRTHRTVLERKHILETIRTTDELVEQGQLVSAKAHLEKIRGSEFLTKEERKLIVENLKKIDIQLDEQKEKWKLITAGPKKKVDAPPSGQESEIAEIYRRSVEFYLAGEFEKARDGFAKIDNILARNVKLSAPTEAKPVGDTLDATIAAIRDELLDVGGEPAEKAEPQIVQEPNKLSAVGAPEPITSEIDSTEVANRRRNILRSYTRAVFNDAVAKAQNYISKGEFDRAKESVERAEQTVNKNRLYLGNSLFRQYSSELRQLAEKIAQGENERAW